jgi:hypothetical protein
LFYGCCQFSCYYYRCYTSGGILCDECLGWSTGTPHLRPSECQTNEQCS